MFLAAVDRSDTGGAKKLQAMSDDAAVRWITETGPTLMAAGDMLPPEIYVRVRDRYSSEFRERFLVPFGQCPERGRTALDEGGDVASLLADCRAREYLTQAGDCSQLLLDMLYELSGYTPANRMEESLKVGREKYRGALQEARTIPGGTDANAAPMTTR